MSDTAMKARIMKALRYLAKGDVGLLYCNPLHSFVAPFVVESGADPNRVVTDVWPEPWVMPFRIRPLSDGSKRISKDLAREKWSLLKRLAWKGSISATLNFTGTTVFVPTEISGSEWAEIVGDLS